MGAAIYAGYLEIAPEFVWGMIFAIAGLFSVAGVIINGRWHRSPSLRRLGALMSFITMAMLAITFFVKSSYSPSLAALLYLTLAAWALWTLINIEGSQNAGNTT